MFDRWPDVEFIATRNDAVVTEIVCPICGTKEKVHNIIGKDLRLPSRLSAVQKSADFYKEKNELWDSIKKFRVDLFEAFYALRKIQRKQEKDNAQGLAVPSFQGGRTEINCTKCGADVGFNYDIRTKFDSEMPDDIPTNVLRTLKPPALEVLGRMLTRKDETPIARTIDGIFELISEERFKTAEAFVAKVKEMSNEIDDEFRSEFEDFLTEFGQWIQKRKDDDFLKYLNSVDSFAKYVVALEESNTSESSIFEKIKDKLKPNKGVVLFAEDVKPPESQ